MIKRYLLASILIFGCIFSNAQVYNFSVTTGTFTFLVNSTSLNNGQVWDDPEYTIPLGFSFKYFDTTVTQLYLDDWGLGAELTTNNTESGSYGVIIPFGPDIMDRGSKFGGMTTETSESNISYETTGSAGSRICKIEWKNVGFYGDIEPDDISSDFANFQLWIYEGTNNLEVHFGPSSISDPTTTYEFLSGPNVALYPSYNFDSSDLDEKGYELSGDADNPSMVEVNFAYENNLDGTVSNGKIFKFTNTSASTPKLKSMNQISLLPNPAKSNFNILLKNKNLTEGKVEILNSIGQNVLTSSMLQEPINIEDLTTGVYSVILYTENEVHTTQLIKE